MRPNFIGLGAQKCASTWIYRVLQDHPEVALSKPKELDFFSDRYVLGLDWYERCFADIALDKRAVGEISPSYLPHPLAPLRAYQYNPDFRIIVALRDPVERAYSNHLHMVRLGYLDGPDLTFERGLERIPMYLTQSMYASHLLNWLDHFALDRLHILFQEEIAMAGDIEASRLYEFLGVRADVRTPSSIARFNESRLSGQGGIHVVLRKGANVARNIGLASVIRRIREIQFVQRWKRAGEVDLRQVIPPMLEDTRRRMADQLMPEMERLRIILGRDNLPWKSWFDNI